MRLIFIRHGEPDYHRDCLTETGRKQAAALAERLAGEGITALYSSSNGRAVETAAYTARRLGLPVTQLDWMREISWGGEGVPAEGHPWTLGEMLIDGEGFNFSASDWRRHPWFARNTALECFDAIVPKLDALLRSHGYRHDGGRFFCETAEEETVALFSHGGSGACALSHLLSLPFPYVCTVLPYGFTSVIILAFPVRKGAFVHPRIELFNDMAHLPDASGATAFQATPDSRIEERPASAENAED